MALHQLVRLGGRRLSPLALARAANAASPLATGRTAAALGPAGRTAAMELRRASPGTTLRPFHSSAAKAGMMPDSENPDPPACEPHDPMPGPANVSLADYSKLADGYLDELLAKLEEAQEKGRELDVEYAAGILQLTVPGKGTYVLNKQPANKQIWLSSPVSGPKRYDWVVMGEAQYQKEDGGVGDWIYMRDSSSLTDLLRKELGVDLSPDGDIP